MATKKTKKEVKVYDGPMAKYLVIKETPYTDEKGKPAGVLEVGSIHDMPTILGDGLVKDGFMELYKEKLIVETKTKEVVVETKKEPEMYEGKKVIEKGEVEINGVTHKTITTEEGSTYTI